jgi:hypothetical protein
LIPFLQFNGSQVQELFEILAQRVWSLLAVACQETDPLKQSLEATTQGNQLTAALSI